MLRVHVTPKHDYTGRLIGVDAAGYEGFIKADTIVKNEGADDIDIAAFGDIPVCYTVVGVRLREGSELTFNVHRNHSDGASGYVVGCADETPGSKLERLAQGGITLSTCSLDGSTVLTSPSVLVTWEITDENVRETIRRMMIDRRTLKLLLVYWPIGDAYGTKNERRTLVNLDDLTATLTFNSSGPYRIVATVLYGEDENKLRNAYLQRWQGGFSTDVIGYDLVSIGGLMGKCEAMQAAKAVS